MNALIHRCITDSSDTVDTIDKLFAALHELKRDYSNLDLNREHRWTVIAETLSDGSVAYSLRVGAEA